MKYLQVTLLGFFLISTLFAKDFSESFTVKTLEGKAEIHFSCSEPDSAQQKKCEVKSTKLVVPDKQIKTSFLELVDKLNSGGDSVRINICKSLQLIEPRSKEAKDIVVLLRDGCEKADNKKLILAYTKMDSLSKITCLILNRSENIKLIAAKNGDWIYSGKNINACFEEKKYVIKTEMPFSRKIVEQIMTYSNKNSPACEAEKQIEVTSTLKQLTDGHFELPDQCRYLYLQ